MTTVDTSDDYSDYPRSGLTPTPSRSLRFASRPTGALEGDSYTAGGGLCRGSDVRHPSLGHLPRKEGTND